jgi:hypothetical protein
MRCHPYRMKILAYLARESLTVGELNIISMTHYASLPPRSMIRMAHAESLDGPAWPPSSRLACRDAIVSLMARGWLQIIDDAALRGIEAQMAFAPAFGPYDGLPEFGDLDFTNEGGSIWRRINRDLFGQDEAEHWTGLGDSESFEYVATSESILRRLLDDETRTSGREILSVSDIVPIGPWRDRWWDAIMVEGYRASGTYRPWPEDD